MMIDSRIVGISAALQYWDLGGIRESVNWRLVNWGRKKGGSRTAPTVY